jgi:diguanylate cyclase (GGDEF)-like protein/PAS domain S-box-containing protein
VSAVTVDQVATAVTNATDALLRKCAHGGALLAVVTDGTLRAVAPGSADPVPLGQPGELAEAWLPLVTGTGPFLAPAARLPECARAFVPGADWMLLCPLGPRERSSGAPLIGLLGVFGEQRVLADLSATLEILAHQVALAMERIMLRDEMTRQGNQAYFRTLVQDTSDAILIVSDEGMVRYATPSAASIFGEVTVEGAYLWELVAEASRDEVGCALRQLRGSPASGPRYVDQRITRHDGVSVQIQVRCSDLRDDPTVAGLVFTIRDITEQRELEEELKHQALHDALTGLPNRVLFQDRIGQQLAAARRTGMTVGVLFVDLDDFKVVNDTIGHGVGDELLVAVAARLTSLIQESGTAARLGGDEFALLIGDVPDSAAVEAAADRVIRAFGKPFPVASGVMLATVTVGVATSKDSADTDDLLRHADLALYAAKAAGKRQWRRYQPVLSTGLMRRRELQAALEEAVACSAFTLAYQPIARLTTGELAGFEALLRWPHPQWGMMRPDQFIALAEETGQIIPLGSWVLARAAADIARWRQDPRQETQDRKPYVSVNVSARQFSASGFVDGVRQALDTSGLEPGALMLELTESVLLRRDERLQADLKELKTVGVKLAIDDFGTGYSSLSYLRELPVDVVKMDKSFVEGIADSTQRLALAEGIVRIARTLQLEVIAEGIESEVQRQMLTTMGCQSGQGYLLAMPMTASEAEEFARTRCGLGVAGPALPGSGQSTSSKSMSRAR